MGVEIDKMNTCENKPEGNYCWKVDCKKWEHCRDRHEPSLVTCSEWMGGVYAQQSSHMVLDTGTVITWTRSHDSTIWTSVLDRLGFEPPDPYLRDPDPQD